ncbi:MAG: ABC transporter permease [Acidobacteriia bacterium]|nr:ABC transporter permease [Terriglobia bacterium]MBV8906823.1 ABC transporter permease [Terriglobia bacterium]MBV9746775.1 ABC transporter permease [Terriglobia bacterium]
MFLGEALRFSVQALRSNPSRSLLTGLGMVIGTASVILVVTISLTSRDYILEQVEGVGSNIIFAYYATSGPDTAIADADYVKLADVQAMRQDLSSEIVAATGVMTNFDRMLIGGKQQDVKVIGTDGAYQSVRNIVSSSGRFLDDSDVTLRSKVALLTDRLAERLYGSRDAAVNQVIKLFGLQFTVIGTFHEKVETFGQSEVERDTILIPITVLKYFTPVERIDPMYVQVRSPQEVDRVATRVQEILEARHRPGARYHVDTLTAILTAVRNISLILSAVLVMVSAITLIISGLGIMNIMLVTVTERTREIGLRLAVGAAPREILLQFLAEAVIVSLSGGLIGILLGVGIPLSVQAFADVRIPISAVAIVVAFVVSCAVGLIFGMLPANRAAHLDPTEALRYE